MLPGDIPWVWSGSSIAAAAQEPLPTLQSTERQVARGALDVDGWCYGSISWDGGKHCPCSLAWRQVFLIHLKSWTPMFLFPGLNGS